LKSDFLKGNVGSNPTLSVDFSDLYPVCTQSNSRKGVHSNKEFEEQP
jgi:hypothetical protein